MNRQTLMREGSATEVAAELRIFAVSENDMRAALVNALQCIAQLQRQVDVLENARDAETRVLGIQKRSAT